MVIMLGTASVAFFLDIVVYSHAVFSHTCFHHFNFPKAQLS